MGFGAASSSPIVYVPRKAAGGREASAAPGGVGLTAMVVAASSAIPPSIIKPKPSHLSIMLPRRAIPPPLTPMSFETALVRYTAAHTAKRTDAMDRQQKKRNRSEGMYSKQTTHAPTMATTKTTTTGTGILTATLTTSMTSTETTGTMVVPTMTTIAPSPPTTTTTMATGTKTLTTSMEAVDGRELCHYPPLTHSCSSRGSSCCAVTVSPNRQNLQPLTWNDVSNSSNAWSHVYSQSIANSSRRTQCASIAHSTNGLSSSARRSRYRRAKKKQTKQLLLLTEIVLSSDHVPFSISYIEDEIIVFDGGN